VKVVSETQNQLILKQNRYSNIFLGIVLFLAGIGVFLIAHQTAPKILSLVFLIIGILIIIFTKFITINIDKTQNSFSLIAAGLLGKKKTNIALDQIKEVSLEEYVSTQYNIAGQNANMGSPMAQTNIVYDLVFYLKDGQGIPIQIKSGGNTFINGLPIGGFGSLLGRNKNVELGNKIATFIGIPFIDRRPPGVIDMLSGITQVNNNQKPFNEIPQS